MIGARWSAATWASKPLATRLTVERDTRSPISAAVRSPAFRAETPSTYAVVSTGACVVRYADDGNVSVRSERCKRGDCLRG